ncbi:uncharacterized protein LOC126678627 [Mercurialis annua]|uniref:uncharacterized protein LOC126678627 n=1 Tax=Mercurialis annua TaxID=3986 RepID=UPI00215E2E07|nr:uncharacterized protein LOC126678627 [Mercurialis annua]
MKYSLGYRFNPRPEELISYLLMRVQEQVLPYDVAIPMVDLYGTMTPWEICSDENERNFFFFTKLKKKKESNTRFIRTSECGEWNGKAKSEKIIDPRTDSILGYRRQFTFKPKNGDGILNSKKGDGKRRNWIMHQYSLPDNLNIQNQHNYVLCQIIRPKRHKKDDDDGEIEDEISINETSTPCNEDHKELAAPEHIMMIPSESVQDMEQKPPMGFDQVSHLNQYTMEPQPVAFDQAVVNQYQRSSAMLHCSAPGSWQIDATHTAQWRFPIAGASHYRTYQDMMISSESEQPPMAFGHAAAVSHLNQYAMEQPPVTIHQAMFNQHLHSADMCQQCSAAAPSQLDATRTTQWGIPATGGSEGPKEFGSAYGPYQKGWFDKLDDECKVRLDQVLGDIIAGKVDFTMVEKQSRQA